MKKHERRWKVWGKDVKELKDRQLDQDVWDRSVYPSHIYLLQSHFLLFN